MFIQSNVIPVGYSHVNAHSWFSSFLY